MAERFYVDSPLEAGPLTLSGAEAHHLSAVCRVRPGDEIVLFNGDGREYRVTVTAIARRQVSLEVIGSSVVNRELHFPLAVACPLPKGDRAQWLIEKLTELGVTNYLPLRTARSVVHPGNGKYQKLRRYVIEASKQCGRNVLMEIGELTEWRQLLRDHGLPQQRYLGHFGGERWPSNFTVAPTIVAVGPEGGLTDDEVTSAVSSGWRTIDLGPRVLRVETAACLLACLAGQFMR
jgi:16S rRNA (uracil1498-N3)-methyltransferase